ncbi:COPI associated protein-domain-containing protein [Dichotomocladium elegans]|nr:COPI associated protein-domain-containing protein [Dichotomocladium elegans]
MAIDSSLIFRVINIVVAAFMIVGGVATIIQEGFPNFIQGIFCIIFGAITLVFEFRLPKQITRYASFMFSFLGRGIFYIFIGGITLNYGGLSIACGAIVLAVGIVYCILEFIPNIQPPSNMEREAFENSLGYHTKPADAGGHFQPPSSSYEPAYPQKTYVSDGAMV